MLQTMLRMSQVWVSITKEVRYSITGQNVPGLWNGSCCSLYPISLIFTTSQQIQN